MLSPRNRREGEGLSASRFRGSCRVGRQSGKNHKSRPSLRRRRQREPHFVAAWTCGRPAPSGPAGSRRGIRETDASRHSRAHTSRVSRKDTRAMTLARALCTTPTRVIPARPARRLSACPARRARVVARADGSETSSSISTSSALPADVVGDGTAEPAARPELLFEPPPVPRPAAVAPPVDPAPVADALEPPLEPEPAPEPHPPTNAEDVAEDGLLDDAEYAASSTALDGESRPESPGGHLSAPSRATRGARPILGRLALCRNDPSLAPYEHLLKARYD